MRSSIAKAIAVALGLCIVLLAGAFAARQNPGAADLPSSPSPTPALPPRTTAQDTATVARGRRLFLEVGCTRCHAVGSEGNRRYPLDEVGARRGEGEIRMWMLARGPVADSLPRSVARAKGRFRDLPTGDLDALVAFLTSLRGPR